MESNLVKKLIVHYEWKKGIEKDIKYLQRENKYVKDKIHFLLKHVHTPLLKLTDKGNTSRDLIIHKDFLKKYTNKDAYKLIQKDVQNCSLFVDHAVNRVLVDSDFSSEGDVLYESYKVEGKVRNVAYVLTYISQIKREKENFVETLHSIEDVVMARQDKELPSFIVHIKENKSLSCLYLGLSVLQDLEDERGEAAEQLQQVPDLIIEGENTNDLILTYQATAQHEIVITWKICPTEMWGKPYFRHFIDVDCSDDTVARFSRSNIFKMLTKEELLLTKNDVIKFFDVFSQ